MSTLSSSGMLIYIIADVFCILLLIPVLQSIHKSVGIESELLTFKYMLLSFLVYVAADLLMVFFIDQTGWPVWLCNIITIIDECSLTFAAYFWVRFGIVRLGYEWRDAKWFRIAVTVPAASIAILSLTSPLTGLFFYITPEGLYQRGPLFMLQAAAVIIYNISIPVMSIHKYFHTKSAAERKKAASLVKFVIAPLVTGVIQLINQYTPIMCLGLVLGIYFVYVDILNMQIYNDSLTGLNNRRRAVDFLSDCISSASPERPFYLFMIDVDYFKNINDKFGHVEGDRALRLVAEALKKTADQNHGFAARYGGDEFMLSTFNNAYNDPDIIASDLNSNLKKICENNRLPYTLAISVGYAKCDSHKAKLVSLINEADQMLYVKKKTHHSSQSNAS